MYLSDARILAVSPYLKAGTALMTLAVASLIATPSWAQATSAVQTNAEGKPDQTDAGNPAATVPSATSVPADADATEDSTKDDKEIVVTGSIIRGVAPVGANVVGINQEEARLSGETDSAVILNKLVPQSERFMELDEPGRGVALGIPRVPVQRPSLRDLGESTAGSGSPTLVLLDGHRIVPAGIEQSVVDVGIIPPGILARTEIVLDGTSALYGSDAVGGTINYIPRKRFDESRVAATYGVADNYYSTSVDVSSGLQWGTGGLGFAYSFGKNSDILDRDRADFAIPRNYLEGERLTQLACEGYGHITIGAGASQRRFISTTLQERTDWCDPGLGSFTPAQERHGLFAVFSQDIGSRVKFDLYGFYSHRKTETQFGPFTSSVIVRPGNPYFRPIPGVPAAQQAQQTVAFSWAPIWGDEASPSKTFLKVGQVSPSLTVDLGGDWQVRLMGAYGRSKSSVDVTSIDTTLVGSLAGGQSGFTSFATAINPYDIAATQNRSLFDNLLWQNQRDGIHTFRQLRAVADGPIFALPGGDARAAIGVEYDKTNFKRRTTNSTTHVLGDYLSASTSNKSIFGEINLPFIGPDNDIPGIHSFTVTASGRYDHYPTFGGTFNPKFAATYYPVEWLTLRGNWGKSFRAPNAVDKLGASGNTIGCTATGVAGCTNFPLEVPAGYVLPPGTNVQLTLSGANPDIKPETATNWAIGGDLRPPIIPGLTLSATYYNIKFKDGIGFPPIAFATVFAAAPELITLNPTPAQIDAFALRAPNGSNTVAFVRSQGYNVIYLRDNTLTNISSRAVSGIDASARYNRPTSFGSIDAFFNGTWRLKEETKVAPNAAVSDGLRVNTSKFRMTAGVGAEIGELRAQLTWQHRAGFDVDPSATRDPAQTHIDGYDLFNMSLRYRVASSMKMLDNTVLTFVVNNIFNNEPPIARTTAGTGTNGSTIGRFFQFGIEKEF